MIASETPHQTGEMTTRQVSARYNRIFGVTLSAVTVIALLVAFFSADVGQSGSHALPASWTRIYNADLTATTHGAWDETQGCSLSGSGLDAVAGDSTDAQCAFKPSVDGAVTSAGFYFVTELAPAADVSAFARSVLSIGDITNSSGSGASTVRFIIAQDGAYTLCDGVCSSTGGNLYLHGGLASWHGDALLSNTLAVKVSPDHSTLTIYVNDQPVATVAPQLGPQPAIAVGAATGSEAIFTHAALYTGN